jgi:hypothetical protein
MNALIGLDLAPDREDRNDEDERLGISEPATPGAVAGGFLETGFPEKLVKFPLVLPHPGRIELANWEKCEFSYVKCSTIASLCN